MAPRHHHARAADPVNGYDFTRIEDITPGDIQRARRLMVAGYSMKQAADRLDIRPASVLDRALWKHIDKAYDRAICAQEPKP